VDGAIVFQSVPGGSFTVRGVAPDGLSGLVSGTLDSEGQVVDVTVVLQGSGQVEGIIRDALGVPVPAADVVLVDSMGKTRGTQSGTTGADVGKFVIEPVPAGAFTIEARPQGALTPGDGGRAAGQITHDGEVAFVEVSFQGTVTIGVVVSGTFGTAPVELTLDSSGLFGGRLAPTRVENGVTLFESVPRAPLFVSAKQATAGITISASASLAAADLPPPGERLVPDLEAKSRRCACWSLIRMAWPWQVRR